MEIRERLGCEPLKVQGYMVAVYLCLPESTKEITTNSGDKVSIELSSQYIENQKYLSVVGVVGSMGEKAYTGEGFDKFKPYCEVGDLVVIPRHEGAQFTHHNKPVMVLPDNKIVAVVDTIDEVKPR